jgi:alkylhydroperoxidase/carboxymuconolactone decarboxylase family protein YurZ
MHVAVYAGVPAANSAFTLAKTILAPDASSESVEHATHGDSST